MKTIMLTGESKKGKTATLHFVHEILIAAGAETTLVVRRGSKHQRDFSDVLKYNGKMIMVLTMGDCEKDIREALSATDCDFLICACNNEHEKFFQQATYRIEKTITDNFSCKLAANWYDANRIVDLLDK